MNTALFLLVMCVKVGISIWILLIIKPRTADLSEVSFWSILF